jgi:hypothetical protein
MSSLFIKLMPFISALAVHIPTPWSFIHASVLQGSVPGLLLFSMFINDLGDAINCSRCSISADHLLQYNILIDYMYRLYTINYMKLNTRKSLISLKEN